MNPGIFTMCPSHREPRTIQPDLLAVTPTSWLPTPCGPPEAWRSLHEAGVTEGSPGSLHCVETLKTLQVLNSGSAQPYIECINTLEAPPGRASLPTGKPGAG